MNSSSARTSRVLLGYPHLSLKAERAVGRGDYELETMFAANVCLLDGTWIGYYGRQKIVEMYVVRYRGEFSWV